MTEVFQPFAYGGVADFFPAQGNRTAGGFLQAGDAIDELALAVAVDTGDADDLSGADIKRDIVHSVFLVKLRVYAQVLHGQDDVPRLGLTFDHFQLDRTANHHIGKSLLVGVFGLDGTDALSLTKDGNPVCHGHNFVELMGNEQNGFPLRRQVFHDLHELINLLGGEHGSRFVKDQNFIFPVEHFKNLYTLLHPDGDVFYLCVQVYLKAIPLGQVQDFGPGFLLFEKP